MTLHDLYPWIMQALLVLVIAAAPLGVFICFSETMILSGYYEAVEKSKLPAWMKKPLATCSQCMVSVWGIPAAAILGLIPPDVVIAAKQIGAFIIDVNTPMGVSVLPTIEALALLKVPVYLFLALWLQAHWQRP